MRRTLKHDHEEHTLILRKFSQGIDYRCDFCKPSYDYDHEPLSGEIDNQAYCCEDCNFFIHKWCAESPQQIHHPSHPQHPLFLVDRSFRCGESGCRVYLEAVSAIATLPPEGHEEKTSDTDQQLDYYTNYDGFHMHARCAVETLSAILKGGATPKIQHFADDNLFFTCYVPELQDGIKDTCVACRKSIEGLGYFCRKTNEKIHKSCAEELKPVLDHPFHPQHPLLLQSSNIEVDDIFFCKGCNRECCYLDGYHYSCGTCGFYLDLKCALRKPTFKDPCHQHDLAHFELVQYMRCNACGYNCNYDLYRCLECNFNVHLDCLPLPSVVENNECHIHPLTLCDKVPDQDCDVCRLETNPRHRAYYCGECNFVADIECAVSKGVKPKHSQLLNKEINIAKGAVQYHQVEMRKHMATLNALESMKKSGWERRSKKSVLLEEDSLFCSMFSFSMILNTNNLLWIC